MNVCYFKPTFRVTYNTVVDNWYTVLWIPPLIYYFLKILLILIIGKGCPLIYLLVEFWIICSPFVSPLPGIIFLPKLPRTHGRKSPFDKGSSTWEAGDRGANFTKDSQWYLCFMSHFFNHRYEDLKQKGTLKIGLCKITRSTHIKPFLKVSLINQCFSTKEHLTMSARIFDCHYWMGATVTQ